MSEYERHLKLMTELQAQAANGDLGASRTLRRMARERRKRIETVNGHKIPGGPKGDNLFLNRLNRRKRLGLV